MNFLAHCFLSFDNDQVLIGNFIADHIQGNNFQNLTPEMIKGIMLHRAIDSFTDAHPITLSSRKKLYPSQRKYAGVVVDMFYDHFLAANFHHYSETTLQLFSQRTYQLLQEYNPYLPTSVLHFLPFMIERNWLLNYATLDGIHTALKGLSRRVKFDNNMHKAIDDLTLNYPVFESEFKSFFPLLIHHSKAVYGI
ncbi:MAG: hypothetical protein RIQ89_451 [Bacteroidota bacterium]|jgi:acyl carrier protein phosphodiesterase